MRTPLDEFASSLPIPVTPHTSGLKPALHEVEKRDSKCGKPVTLTETARLWVATPVCPESELVPAQSARVYVPALDLTVWIASDGEEAARLREELAREDDTQPIIVASDVVRLQGEPQVEIDAAVRILATYPGARVVYAGPIKQHDVGTQTSNDTTTEPAAWAGAAAESRRLVPNSARRTAPATGAVSTLSGAENRESGGLVREPRKGHRNRPKGTAR
jgi:hypothetical protein